MNRIFVPQRGFDYSPKNRKIKDFFKNMNWKIIWKICAVLAGIGFLFVAGIFVYFAKDLPSPGKVNKRFIAESTKIYDRTGQHLLYDIHGEEKRTLIPFSEIPDSMKYATITLEDQDFYSHHGIKITSIIRSALKNVLDTGVSQGGSTITQQFVKNSLLTSEKKITRKIKEAILAIEIEQKFSKDEILEMYLNEIPYGSNAYGVEAAAQTFFAKHAKDLTLDESAMLASLPQAPSRYSPYGSKTELLKSRQEFALQKMADLGYITQQQADEAKAVDVFYKLGANREDIKAPHMVMYVKEYIEEKYGKEAVEEGGYKIYTTLDWDKQQIAEKAVAEGAEKNTLSWNATNAALVAMDPKTGQILAMVGSKDYFNKEIDGQVNVAVRQRQPGSSFKPYVYLNAFIKGYTPETIIYDTPTEFETGEEENYEPQNYDGKFSGPLKMKEALGRSLNIPAVKTLYLVGVKDSINLAKRMGITDLNYPDRYGLSLVLGGGEVQLLDHVNAFATLANGGVFKRKTAILRIENKEGEIVEEYQDMQGERVVEEKYVAMLDHILSTNNYRAPTFGENNPLRFDNRPVVAKTGTTNEFRDGWTMGYTPSIAVGVWAGNNDNAAMKAGAAGANVASPIWRSFMDQVLQNYTVEEFPKYEEEETGKDILDGKLEDEKEIKVCEIPDKKDRYCLANKYCASDEVKKRDFVTAYTILKYVDKDDPRGDEPSDPKSDPQYKNWQEGIEKWYEKEDKKTIFGEKPDECKESDFQHNLPSVSFSVSKKAGKLTIKASVDAPYGVDEVEFKIGGDTINTKSSSPYTVSYDIPAEDVGTSKEVRVKVTDKNGNDASSSKSVSL